MAFGRVDDEGVVYVRTPDGERTVGSYPGASPAEALAYYARKYDEIGAQIELFAQRLTAADVPVSEVDTGLARLRAAVTEPNVVGDIAALNGRVEALAPVAAARRAEVEAVRKAARDQARERRTALVDEAEQIAATPVETMQWRSTSQRMKDIFEQWQLDQKSDVRLDRTSQDELWKRFSHARTAFDLYSGDDSYTLPLLAVGAVGVVGTSTHWTGPWFQKMIAAFESGDAVLARAINAQLYF